MSKSIMHILIDGYNLIRQSADFKRFERHSLEAGRNALIQWLSEYKRRKNHFITVVFDGWVSGAPLEERDNIAGVNIIYSPRGVKADDIIKRIAASAEEEILVISSDREISSFAVRRGKAALSSLEFEAIVNRHLTLSAPLSRMDQKAEDAERATRKKGPSRRPSRAQKLMQSKIKKL